MTSKAIRPSATKTHKKAFMACAASYAAPANSMNSMSTMPKMTLGACRVNMITVDFLRAYAAA
jgi:hypothetical protein